MPHTPRRESTLGFVVYERLLERTDDHLIHRPGFLFFSWQLSRIMMDSMAIEFSVIVAVREKLSARGRWYCPSPCWRSLPWRRFTCEALWRITIMKVENKKSFFSSFLRVQEPEKH